MGKMRRTQVYLEPELTEALDRLAERRGTSRASLLREAARHLVASEAPIEDDPLFAIIGMGRSGLSDVSERHDEYLIEAELDKWKRQ